MPRITSLPARGPTPAIDLNSVIPMVDLTTGATVRVTLANLISLLGLARQVDLATASATAASATASASATAASATASVATTVGIVEAAATAAASQARYARWVFLDGGNDLRLSGGRTILNFAQTGDAFTVSWSLVRLLDGATTIRVVNDLGITVLAADQCIYINAAGAVPFVPVVGTFSALEQTFVTGTNVLLLANYTGLLLGALAPAFTQQRLRADLGARGSQPSAFTALAALDLSIAELATAVTVSVADLTTALSAHGASFQRLADGSAESGGFALLLDGAQNVLLRKTPAGLDFIPDPAVVARIGGQVIAQIGGTSKGLTGRALLLDSGGNMLLAKTPTGLNFIPSDDLKAALGGAISGAPANATYSKRDTLGRLVYGYVLPNGQTEEYVVAGGYPLLHGARSLDVVVVDVISVNGQSLSVGDFFSNVANAPVITAADDAFILSGVKDLANDLTVRGWLSRAYSATSPATPATGIKPLVMGNTTVAPIPTPATAIAGTLNKNRRAVGARRASVLTANHGYSGVAWQNLDSSAGTGTGDLTIWNNLVYWYQQAKAALGIVGVGMDVPWHVLIHGTANKSDAIDTYYAFLVDYRAAFGAFLASESIPGAARLILTQDGGDSDTTQAGEDWNVKLDQLRFCREGLGVMAGPLYPIRIADNNVHPDGENTLLFGEIIARAIAEEDARRRWTTLSPNYWTVTGNSITLHFDTRPDEILQLHAATKYSVGGIDAWAGFQCPGTTITALSIGPTWVKLTTTAAPTAVRYAMQAQDVTARNDGYTAHRGLLRSSYTWKSKWSNVDLYRWAPSFAITL